MALPATLFQLKTAADSLLLVVAALLLDVRRLRARPHPSSVGIGGTLFGSGDISAFLTIVIAATTVTIRAQALIHIGASNNTHGQ
jgi:hypothetical protein